MKADVRDWTTIPDPVATAWDAGRRLGLSSLTTRDGCLHLVLMDVRPDGKTRFRHLSSNGHRMLRARSHLSPGPVDPVPAGIAYAVGFERGRGIFAPGTISECVRAFLSASRAWDAWPEADAALATAAWGALIRRCGPACLSVLADDGAPGWLSEADALLGTDTVDRLLGLYPILAGPLRVHVRRQSSSPRPDTVTFGDLSPAAVAEAAVSILDGDGTAADVLNPPPGPDDRGLRRKAVARLLSRLRGVYLPGGHGADALRASWHVPYDWIPGDAEGAVGMAALVRAAATLSAASAGALPAATLVAPVKGRWHEAHATVLADFPGMLQDHNFPDWTSHIADMVQAFRLEVLAPATLHADAIPSFRPPRLPPSRAEMDAASWKGLFSGMGLVSVAKASREWHRRSAHITQGVRAIDANAGLSWGQPFETFVAPNGTTIVPMLTSDDLVDEGIALLHCIAGYAEGCHGGAFAIGSVRTQGRRTSTVQLARVPPGKGAGIRSLQHRGFHNGDPSPEDEAAVESLVAHLNASLPAGPFPPSSPTPARTKGRKPAPGPAYEGHPYDPRPRESVERAIRLWAKFLPRTARDAAGVVALVDPDRARAVTDDVARTPRRRLVRRVLVALRMRFVPPWHPPGTEGRGGA